MKKTKSKLKKIKDKLSSSYKKFLIYNYYFHKHPVAIIKAPLFLLLNGPRMFFSKMNEVEKRVINVHFDNKLSIFKYISLTNIIKSMIMKFILGERSKGIIERVKYKRIQNIESSMSFIAIIKHDANWKEVYRSLISFKNQNDPYWNLRLVVYKKASWISKLKLFVDNDTRLSLNFVNSVTEIPKSVNKLMNNENQHYVGIAQLPLELFPNALNEVCHYLSTSNDIDLLYFDEDVSNNRYKHSDPLFKPNYSLDLLLSSNYFGKFIILNKKTFLEIGSFSDNCSFVFDYFLKLSEYSNNFHHIPKVLFSELSNYRHKRLIENDKQLLSESFKRRGWMVKSNFNIMSNSFINVFQVKTPKLVSVIIPTKDHLELLRKSVNGVLSQPYKNYEIIIVNNNSEHTDTIVYLEELSNNPKINIIDFNESFNISKIFNNAVKEAKGDYLLLLNNDVEPITKDWITPLVGYMQRSDIGGVAPKLLYPDGSLQHAGVLLGMKNKIDELGVAGHPFQKAPDKLPSNNPRYYFKDVTRNWSAVTGACFMTKKFLYNKVGGFEEDYLKVLFSDVDYCLKLRKQNYNIVYDPNIVLTHHESVSIGKIKKTSRTIDMNEILYMRNKWGELIDNDPFYNPQLSLLGKAFSFSDSSSKSFSLMSLLKSFSKESYINKFYKSFKILSQNGPHALYSKILEKRIVKDQVEWYNYQYGQWIQKIEPSDFINVRNKLKKIQTSPKISVLIPTYNSDVIWLDKAILSVINQFYKNWEICIVDDGSSNIQTKNYLKALYHKNIKVIMNKSNKGISYATQRALQEASGEYIALLDHDDELSTHALAAIAELLNEHPEADMIYSDEDKINENGQRCDVFFKPDWSPEYFLSSMYTGHLGVYRSSLAKRIGGFRTGYEGSQDYDFVLRLTEKTNSIFHIPMVLYHWRKIAGSTATAYSEKDYAHESAKKALQDTMRRRKIKGTLLPGIRPDLFYVKPNIINNPLVSIIIPNKDSVEYLRKCVESIVKRSTYKNYEIFIINNNSTKPETFSYYQEISNTNNIFVFDYNKPFNYSDNIFVFDYNKPFNYSEVNNFGSKKSHGEFLLFLNNDTEVIEPNWIEALLEYAQLPDIGAVGAKLVYPDNTLQHGGVILGISNIAGHSQKYFPAFEAGKLPIYNNKDLIRNWSAVTAACLMIEKKKYLLVKGMDNKFQVAFNDIDFCLRLSKLGLRHVYTPYSLLYHHESVSVGKPESYQRNLSLYRKEVLLFQKRWSTVVNNDPYYNRNLTLERENLDIKL